MNINRLFVANKPKGISCNFFLKEIKKRYCVKKAGFSGTLDPFANGCLIVAFGQYTKLFNYLQKTPKVYTATLHLGAKSDSLDIEKVEKVELIQKIPLDKIQQIAQKLLGEVTYFPPKYSAKRVNGKRAYEFARQNKDVNLKAITTTIYKLEIKNYIHPFITFEVSVSEGGYIRSIGKMIADELGVEGSLSELQRVNEGKFIYNNEESIDPTSLLKIKKNFYMQDKNDVLLGKVLNKKDFKIQEDGEYFLVNSNFLSIVKIENDEVQYRLNRIELC